MKTTVLDALLARHEVVNCDKCTAQWTPDVAVKRGWLLSDTKDLCERCRPQKKERQR